MENKKPLIIVPPMSEPMKKLKEVLEGIAVEENIDIFEVEDAKEFGQLLGSGGQSLVMMSNAKLCATLLQENRASIIKNNIKVILLTPKEIPQKTLVKFTKVGLTEAILENSPPKTLLYKVKLLLRSIKAKAKEENTQQVVKSMLDMNAKSSNTEELVTKEMEGNKNSEAEVENSDQKKKFTKDDEGEKLDYLSNLKGKRKQAEDVIDTHWKSKRDTNESLEVDIEKGTNKKEIDYDDIDNYYRGKSKRIENVEIELEDAEKKMREVLEETDRDLFKRKNIDETELDLDSNMAPKKKEAIEDEEESPYINKRVDEEELERTDDSKKAKEVENELDIDALREKLLDDAIEENETKNNREKSDVEDLGGHYKGKIKKTNENNDEDEFVDERSDDTILSEEAEDKKKRAEDSTDSQLKENERPKLASEIEADDETPNESEVDHIDGFLRGKIDNNRSVELEIDSNEEDKSKEAELVDELDAKEKKSKIISEDEEDTDKKSKKEREEESSLDGIKREKLIEEIEDKDYKREALITEDEENGKNRKLSEKIEEDLDAHEKNEAKTKILEEDDDLNHRESGEKTEDKDFERKNLNQSKLDLAPGESNNVHEGQTDHISTYYKSGENKDKEHDWNLKQDKKDSVKLDLLKNTTEESVIAAKSKTDYGETTIDYKKLKEEFDLISRGENISSSAVSLENGSDLGKNYNSEDQYKVVEVRPSALLYSVELLNLIYMPDTKGIDIIRSIAQKIWKSYSAVLVISKLNPSDQKYQESYNAYIDMAQALDQATRDFWDEYKKDQTKLDELKSYSMPHFICRDIAGKDGYWKDLELAPLPESETISKSFEYIYPFYDGVSKIGHAHLFLNKGIKKSEEMDIVLSIEFLRCALLENFSKSKAKEEEQTDETPKKESKILNLFGNLFKKNAG